MSKICRFFNYWWESITKSKDAFDKIAWALTALAWLVVVVIEWGGFSLPENWKVLTEPTFGKAAWSVAVALALRAVFWLPFVKNEAQQTSHAKEKEKLASIYAEQTRVLENQIHSFKAQLDDRTIRKLNKDFLGLYLEQLETRILTIEKMDSKDYMSNLKIGFDDESLLLIGGIKTFIIQNIGKGEAALFSRHSELTPAVADPSLGGLAEKERRKWMIECLNYYAKQLQEIIRNY